MFQVNSMGSCFKSKYLVHVLSVFQNLFCNGWPIKGHENNYSTKFKSISQERKKK